jgi:hypothetical protein
MQAFFSGYFPHFDTISEGREEFVHGEYVSISGSIAPRNTFRCKYGAA